MQVKHLEWCPDCSITAAFILQYSINYSYREQVTCRGCIGSPGPCLNNSYAVRLSLPYVTEVQQVHLPEGRGQDGNPGLSDCRACAVKPWAIQPCVAVICAVSEPCSCSQRSLLSSLFRQCGQAQESQRVLVRCIPHRFPGPSSIGSSITCKPCAGPSTLSPPDASQ